MNARRDVTLVVVACVVVVAACATLVWIVISRAVGVSPAASSTPASDTIHSLVLRFVDYTVPSSSHSPNNSTSLYTSPHQQT